MTDAATGADASAVRHWNERVVIEAMTGRSNLRVSEVAALTGLTAASSREVLRALEQKGWVLATRPERAGMGRPARTYQLRDLPADILGVDVGGHTVRAVLLRPDGALSPVGRASIPSPRATMESTLAAIRMATASVDARDVWMTGLALSGALDDAGTVTRSVALPHLEGLNAGPVFDAVLPGRLLICHDTLAALWAETTIGAVTDTPHVMLVHLGRRPSIALMINGESYTGGHGTAGDLSLSDLIPAWDEEATRAAYGHEADPVGAALEAAVAGEPDAVAAAQRFFRQIMPQLAFAAALVDPAVIVIAGALAPVVRPIVEEFREALSARVLRAPEVTVSDLDEYAVASGAAVLARTQLRRILLDTGAGVAPVERASLALG